MSARDLLHRAQVAGVQVQADNGELVLLGDSDAVDALVPEATARKAELLQELTKPTLPRELKRQIEFVAQFHGFTPQELAEAKEIAAGDIKDATTCFQALVADIVVKNQH